MSIGPRQTRLIVINQALRRADRSSIVPLTDRRDNVPR